MPCDVVEIGGFFTTGTSTRKVDDLVRALGCDTGVSKSTVSRICAEIDDEVEVFRTRRMTNSDSVSSLRSANQLSRRCAARIDKPWLGSVNYWLYHRRTAFIYSSMRVTHRLRRSRSENH